MPAARTPRLRRSRRQLIRQKSLISELLRPPSGGFLFDRCPADVCAHGRSPTPLPCHPPQPARRLTARAGSRTCALWGSHMTDTLNDAPLLMGADAIGAFLGLSERQVRHLVAKNAIPTFKLQKSALVCARPATLRAWLAEQEAAALAHKNKETAA